MKNLNETIINWNMSADRDQQTKKIHENSDKKKYWIFLHVECVGDKRRRDWNPISERLYTNNKKNCPTKILGRIPRRMGERRKNERNKTKVVVVVFHLLYL